MSRLDSRQKPAELISTTAAAKRLGISGQGVRSFIAAGQLKAIKVGRLIKVDAQSVEDFISKNAIGV